MTKDAWDIALVILTGIGALFTGVAAVATAFAARGAYKAADVALEVAGADAQREKERYDRRAAVHAAYVYNQIAVVQRVVQDTQGVASGVAAATDEAVMEKLAHRLASCADVWQTAIDAIRPENIAELPDICAASTAGAISQSRFTMILANNAVKKFFKEQADPDEFQRNARIIEDHCAKIARNLTPYIEYAKAHFDGMLYERK